MAGEGIKLLHSVTRASTTGSTRSVILLHGLLGNHRNLYGLAPFVRRHANAVFADLRNHGASFHSQDDALSSHVEDLAALARSVGGKVSVIGHSFGGRVAMEFALRYKEALESLVILDISPRKFSPAEREELSTLGYIRALQAIDLSLGRESVESEILRIAGNKPLADFFRTNLIELGGSLSWRVNFPAILSSFPSNFSFDYSRSQFPGPSLVVFGTESEFRVGEDRAEFEKYFPSIVMKSVKAGHWLHAEKPQEVGALIEAHLAALETKS